MSKKDNNNVHVVNLASYELPTIVEDTREDWVFYGEDNNYFEWLIDRYRYSTTNNSIINNMSRLIYGRGLDALNANRNVNDYAQMKALFSASTLRKVTKELKMLGNAAFQCIYNKQHTKIAKVEHIDVHRLRAGKCNDKGQITHYFYSDNWEDTRKFPPTRIDAFGFGKSEIEILYIQPFTVGMKYYSSVDYEGCLPYTVLEEEMSDFLINDVQNHFSPERIINFNNGVPSDEQQDKIVAKAEAKLSGSKGKKTVYSFNTNKEMETTIESVPLSDAPEHYSYLATEAQQKILNAHGVISPMIVGIVSENQGFSSNADEIEVALRTFYNIAIVPLQDLIIDAVDTILAVNGVSLDLYFKRLSLNEDIEKDQQQKESLSMSAHLDGLLAGFGETINDEEWTLLDERDVDYDNEENFNNQVKEWESDIRKSLEPQTALGKLYSKLAGTGTARPNAKSSQDKEVDGFYFKVRYEYTGSQVGERDFCNSMMKAKKLYRKEDITAMNSHIVNSGHGHKGQSYDIFLYKGGVNCKHKWKRKTFVSATKSIDTKSPLAPTVSTNKAQKFGYRVDNPTPVSMKPTDMPNNGHHPNYNK